jgi:type II secretory pathway pseudopilin PulG
VKGRIMSRAKQGVVLLEALVSMTILATVATTAIALTVESAQTVSRARQNDREMRSANAFLSTVALWPREDLDRHLGDRLQGRWVMRIDKTRAALYTITLSDTNPHRRLLATSLFRPD